MARLQRVTHKLFAENAPVVESGNTSVEIGQFGSALAGTYVATNDVATLQALPAYTRGWGGAIIADEQLPTLEDMNAVQRVQSYQTGYLFQEGIAEYDANSEYGIGSICKVVEGTDVKLYKSLIADNVGNPITDTNSWEELSFGGGGLEIGDIGFTQMAIDESLGKRRKLNGSIIVKDQYPVLAQIIETTQALFPDNFCTEEEWQAEVSATGFCGKYVVGTDTIRLPKYPEYLIAGLANTVPVIGNGKTIGLEASGTFAGLVSGADTAVVARIPAYGTNAGAMTSSNNVGSKNWGLTTDPTNSGFIARLDEAGNKIYGTYFIQVATGSEYQENITNEIELNNPFVLLEGQYFTAPVYNSSWLQSNVGFTGSSALHPTAYNALLVEQNSNVEVGTTVDNYTKRGLSVKLNTEAYTDYDFVLNTTDQTFRCPLKINKASGRAVVGNGTAIGYTNGTSNFAITQHTNAGYQIASDNGYGSQVGASATGDYPTDGAVGLTTDPTKSGIETSDQDLYLYFYVGETVQNANLVNVGRVEEKIVSVIPENSSLICSYLTPDFTTEVQRSNTGFTSEKVQWLRIFGNSKGYGVTVGINGITVYISQISTLTAYTERSFSMVLLNKGDVVTTGIGSNGTLELFTYDCKGVN